MFWSRSTNFGRSGQRNKKSWFILKLEPENLAVPFSYKLAQRPSNTFLRVRYPAWSQNQWRESDRLQEYAGDAEDAGPFPSFLPCTMSFVGGRGSSS